VTILLAVHSPFAIWTIPLEYVERLRAAFPAHTFLHAKDHAEASALYPAADVVFAGQITRAQFTAARRLRWLHSPAAGVGGMLFPEMIASDVVLTNSRGMSAETIAEHVLAVTLAIFRRLPHAFRSQAAREWAQDAIGAERNRLIAGSHVLVVGLGSIGTAVARRFRLLGARVTGLRRRVPETPDGDWTAAPADRLHALLPDADVVVIAAPHTRDTRNLIGARALGLMSRAAVLVNVSRGQLVDEAALVAALRTGTIAAAALDVFVDEPLPPESPFWDLPNVLVTPHTSGFRPDHWDAAVDLFADNLRRFDAGEPLLNVVDKDAGY
jgi:phosphoglycerate dehydrogenase-like enzyme